MVSMESVELNELAEDVVNNLQDQAQKKNISLRYYGHPDHTFREYVMCFMKCCTI